MSYIKDFTIRPKEGQFLKPFDIVGKIADGQECCVIAHDSPVCAFHEGGYFRMSGSRYPLDGITEATPIPHSDTWPAGSDWSTDDWEDRGIYPPRPVQQAVLIVELSDGRSMEITAPFTDETPESEEAQTEHQMSMHVFASLISGAYRITDLGYAPLTVNTRWAWQEKPKAK